MNWITLASSGGIFLLILYFLYLLLFFLNLCSSALSSFLFCTLPIVSVALLSVPAIQLSPTFKCSSLVQCWFLPSQGGIDELPLAVSVGIPILVLASLLIFSLLPLINCTLGAQLSAPLWVSASVSISCWMKFLW